MSDSPPELIAIDHDDYHARYIGRTSDDRQFFLTTPFVPVVDGGKRREFVALFLFDVEGQLSEARIDEIERRRFFNNRTREKILGLRLSELGDVAHGRIEVKPFRTEQFGIAFGLIPIEDEESGWWVEMQPGNYMAFYDPWDSGEYDT